VLDGVVEVVATGMVEGGSAAAGGGMLWFPGFGWGVVRDGLGPPNLGDFALCRSSEDCCFAHFCVCKNSWCL
jgi:hypothetical protein